MKTANKDITTFKAMCIAADVNYPNALYQRKKHPSLTDEEVIRICCNDKGVLDLSDEDKAKYYKDKKKPFMIMCQEEGLDYAMAYMYWRRHPDMTEDEVITYYRLKKSFKHISKDMTKGYYMVVTFSAEKEAVAELDRICRINQNVVRHLIVNLEEK